MLATAIFDHLFVKSNISAMDRLVVVKFHINIANDTNNKKAQLTLTNPHDAEACKNCSNSTCFVSFHRITFR